MCTQPGPQYQREQLTKISMKEEMERRRKCELAGIKDNQWERV